MQDHSKHPEGTGSNRIYIMHLEESATITHTQKKKEKKKTHTHTWKAKMGLPPPPPATAYFFPNRQPNVKVPFLCRLQVNEISQSQPRYLIALIYD